MLWSYKNHPKLWRISTNNDFYEQNFLICEEQPNNRPTNFLEAPRRKVLDAWEKKQSFHQNKTRNRAIFESHYQAIVDDFPRLPCRWHSPSNIKCRLRYGYITPLSSPFFVQLNIENFTLRIAHWLISRKGTATLSPSVFMLCWCHQPYQLTTYVTFFEFPPPRFEQQVSESRVDTTLIIFLCLARLLLRHTCGAYQRVEHSKLRLIVLVPPYQVADAHRRACHFMVF